MPGYRWHLGPIRPPNFCLGFDCLSSGWTKHRRRLSALPTEIVTRSVHQRVAQVELLTMPTPVQSSK